MNVSNISNLIKKFSSPKYVLASRKKAKKRHLLNEDKLLEKLSKFGFEKFILRFKF